MTTPFKPHQIAASDALVEVLKKRGVALLLGEPRTGKTRTLFRTLDLLPVKRALFITKKNAIPGIEREAHVCRTPVDITNYEQAHKFNPDDYDITVLDESHVISTVGKPSQRYKTLRSLCWDKPVILATGTPVAESPNALYYQFGVTKYTPYRYKNFYEFFRAHGIPHQIKIMDRWVETYKKARPEVLEMAEPYIVRITQDDAGITAKAADKVHRVTLSPQTLALIATLRKDSIAGDLVCESEMQLRVYLHQIETGALLVDDDLRMLPNTEVVDYIRKTFGDSPDVAVMAHFRATREKIRQCLPNVSIYSSDGNAEGCDLSHYKHFVIVNTGYSGAKHIQRRERIVNMNVTDERVVHHIVCAGQLSEAVYRQVSKKANFTREHMRGYLNG